MRSARQRWAQSFSRQPRARAANQACRFAQACPIAFQLTRNFGQNMRMVRTHRTTKHNRPERYKLVYQRGTDDGPPIGRQLDRRLCERGAAPLGFVAI